MALHHQPTYPGIVLPCRDLGMVEVVQREKKGKPEVNKRIIATPRWHQPLKELADARDLAPSIQKQVEQFFVTTAALTGKQLVIKGRATRRKTEKFVEENRM